MCDIAKRIQEIADNENISINEMERVIGASRGVLSRAAKNGTDIQSKWVKSVVENYRSYSPDWLLTGHGEMLRTSEERVIDMAPIHTPKYAEPRLEEQFVPYYSIEATAGVLEHLDNSVEYQIGQIMIPNMPRCDGAVSITGDSMYPLLKSGDIVAFQVVHDINNIHFGDMYLVSINEDGDTYITVKWVKKHPSDPNKAVLESHNPNYSPRDVLLRHIHKIALIKFSIRYNSMG